MAATAGLALLLAQARRETPELSRSGEATEFVVDAAHQVPDASKQGFAENQASEESALAVEVPASTAGTRLEATRVPVSESSEVARAATGGDSYALRSVRFSTKAGAGAATDRGGLSLLIYRTESGETVTSLPWSHEGVSAQLPMSGLSACLKVDAAGHGEPAAIPDDLDPCDVVVRMPELCSARLQMVEEIGREPIIGANVRLEELGRDGTAAEHVAVEQVTDANGQALIPELARGRWQLTVELEGYDTRMTRFDLTAEPGTEQDWGTVGMTQFRPLPVRLVGAPADETFEGFTVDLNFADQAVDFNRDGLGILQVGWYLPPLQVIVKYPDGRYKVSSFHDIEPGSGEEAKVQIVSDRTLEIRLRYLGEAAKVIGDSKCWLRIASKGEGSDTFQSSRPVHGEGDYVFPDVTKADVEVSFATRFGDWPVEWASTSATLKEGETTVVALEVKEAPTAVQFHESAGTPLSAFSFHLRRVNDRTSFLASNVTDADGMAELMPELASGFVVTGGTLEGPVLYCLDARFTFDPNAPDTPTAVIGPFVDFFLDVLVDGSPVKGVNFHFHGGVNDKFDEGYSTDEAGRIAPAPYAESSRIRAYLRSDEFWWDLPSLILQPGRNAVTLTRLGTVTASSRETLGKLQSQARGTSVHQWVQSGKVKYIEGPQGGWSCQIPIGSYSLQNGTEEPAVLQVTAQGSLSL